MCLWRACGVKPTLGAEVRMLRDVSVYYSIVVVAQCMKGNKWKKLLPKLHDASFGKKTKVKGLLEGW